MKFIDSRQFKSLIRNKDYEQAKNAIVTKEYTSPAPEMLADRCVKFIISDESVDRHGDIIKSSAWDVSHYLRNPVVLWCHKDEDPPIGRCIDLFQEKGSLKAVAQFVSSHMPIAGQFADMVLRMCQEGFLNATSVGFMAQDWQETTDDARSKDPLNPGVDFNQVDMLEFSIVPLPANPNALILARAPSGIIKAGSAINKNNIRRRELEILSLL